MCEIEITRVSDGNRHYFRYLEDVAEWLTRWYAREVYVSDLESQIDTPYEGCYFIVFGEKYHLKINKEE